MNLPLRFSKDTSDHHSVDLDNWEITAIFILLIIIFTIQICCMFDCCFGCKTRKCCDKNS